MGKNTLRVDLLVVPQRRRRDGRDALHLQVEVALGTLGALVRSSLPVLYAASEDSGRSNRLILLGGIAWVALVLVNWGVSFFVV